MPMPVVDIKIALNDNILSFTCVNYFDTEEISKETNQSGIGLENVKRRLALLYPKNHEDCKYAHIPKTNTQFWIDKLTSNVERDKTNTEKLTVAGWNVLVVWECEVRHTYKHDIAPLIDNLINSILEKQPRIISLKFYEERENKISIVAEETLEDPSTPNKTD